MSPRGDKKVRTALAAAFLLFAAALFVAGPAEASRTTDARSSLAAISATTLAPSSLELSSPAALELVEPTAPIESSPRFGFAEDLALLDPKAGPGGFVVFAAEAAQCELTYARNNPLRYVDPDGRTAFEAVSGFFNALASNHFGGAGRVNSGGSDYRRGQYYGDAASVVVGFAEIVFGSSGKAGGAALVLSGKGAALAPSAIAASAGLTALGISAAGEGLGNLMMSGEGGGSEGRNPAQDKALSAGDIKLLEKNKYDVHELKGGDGTGKYDLYKDKQGNVYVKVKGSREAGEPLGINLKVLRGVPHD